MYHALVSSILELTNDVREIRLKLVDPPMIDFIAGQHITIEMTETQAGIPHLKKRPYSIASSPSEKHEICLCVKNTSEETGSSPLCALKPLDHVLFKMPDSLFGVDQNNLKQCSLFVATGTGIAPIKSMIGDLIETKSSRLILLYWGLRCEADLYYQNELKMWADRHPLFQVITTLSQPTPSWQGTCGRVTDHLQRAIEKIEGMDAYLCGNGEMVKAVRQMLLSKGMDKEAIHFEKFY
ncbi:MAG: FAD-binding oxidoreductase [Nitrospirota bacterium]